MRLINLAIFCLFILSNSVLSYENRILIKVNNEIITTVDILNEIEYLTLLNKSYEKLSEKEIYEISKNSLIKEKIKKIELKKNFKKIEIEENIFNNLMENYVQRFNFNSLIEFKEYLNLNNIKYSEFKNKTTVEFLWNRLIYDKFYKNVKIDKERIKKEILSQEKKKELLLSEILFNLETKENLNKKYNLILNTINKKNFETAASLFSISNTSNNGGEVGWVMLSGLNKQIKKNLGSIEKNKITKPIVVPGGFLILKINEIREIKNLGNLEDQINTVTEQIINKQLNQHSMIYFNKIKKNIKVNEL